VLGRPLVWWYAPLRPTSKAWGGGQSALWRWARERRFLLLSPGGAWRTQNEHQLALMHQAELTTTVRFWFEETDAPVVAERVEPHRSDDAWNERARFPLLQ
jgi:hypothetical protein